MYLSISKLLPNHLFTECIKDSAPLFNSSGVNTDRTSHSRRFGCRLLAKTPTRGERTSARNSKWEEEGGGGMDEQVLMFLVSTDTGIGYAIIIL